jgi:pimeloyl-ACP methyl ester carboxylesterase
MSRKTPGWAKVTGTIAGGTLAALAGGLAYSRYGIDHAVPLPPALDAERETFLDAEAGQLSYYVDRQGSGRPLVLIHSINAAASAYEMRPLFARYRGQRPVYALDLPGFGFSARANRAYTPQLYAAAIRAFLERLGAARAGGADVVALSLGAEFAAWVALEHPQLIRSLALISPTGFSARERATRRDAEARTHRVLAQPLYAQALYDALTSRWSLRAFLARSFVREPDPGLVEYSYATAHQPGARFAPLYFISGQLFTPAIREHVYERLAQPTLVLYDEDAYTRFETLLATVRTRENWRVARLVPSKGLPQFDRPDETVAALDQFWRDIATGQPARPARADGRV